ncbi:MAG: hypothetical protein WA982_00650 [Rubrobacteraceae bacterium]
MRVIVMNGSKLFFLFGVALLAALLFASSAGAIETRSGDDVVIGSDEVVEDDLYAGADNVTVDGTVKGDLVAGGGTIRINGTVEGDLIAAGQTVIVNGKVEDDARIAGQALVIGEDARIADDLISAAYSLEGKPGSTVGGELIYGGYQALLAGTVDQNVRGGMGALELDGNVGGNVNVGVGGANGEPTGAQFAPNPEVTLPDVEPGLTLTDSARVGGNLNYESSTRGDIASGAEIAGNVNYQEVAADEAAEPGPTGATAVLLDSARRFVTLLLIGLLLVWVTPGLVRGAADVLRDRPLISLGWGALDFVVFGVAALLVLLATVLLALGFGLVTLGGLAAAIIGLGTLAEVVLAVVFAIAIGFLAPVIVSFLGGRMLLGWALPDRAEDRVLPLVAGLILYVLLRAIPILGILVAIAVALIGLGALSIWIWTKLKPKSTYLPTES